MAVANAGAYLTATSPDGVATDALDLKLAIAIGDATNVTATVDPAGSVTPATLNGAINQVTHDLTAQIDTKADSTDLDKTNTEVAKKADSEEVKTQVDAVNKSITNLSSTVSANKDATDKALATKADQAAVTDQISKQVTKINAVLDTKVTADYSYSKAELDKKLLDLTTDTNGKVDAGQVSTMIEGKADKTDVDKQIKAVNDAVATKADKATVDAEISKIDFTPYAKTADVDAKVKTVTDLANTKASQNDLDHLNIVKADKSDTYTKNDVDSKVKTVTDLANGKLNYKYVGNGYDMLSSDGFWGVIESNNSQNLKNIPPMGNKTWVYALKLLRDGWGQVIIFSQDNTIWQNSLNGNTWSGWMQYANKTDASNLQNNINAKLNTTDFNSRVNISGQLFRMLDNASDWNAIFGVPNGNNVLTSLRINGTAPGTLLNNFSAGVGFGGGDTKGVLTVAYGDHQARITGGNGSAPVWSEDIAWKSDISNLLNQLNQQAQTIQSLTTRLTNAENEINYIKANYVEGRTFPASQEAQATSWENANPQRIAFITK